MLNDGPRGVRMLAILHGLALFAARGLEPNGAAYRVADVVRRDLRVDTIEPDRLMCLWADYVQDELQWEPTDSEGSNNIRTVLERAGWKSRLRTGREIFERWVEGETLSIMVPPKDENAPEPPIRGGRKFTAAPVLDCYYAEFDRGEGQEEGWVIEVEYPDTTPQVVVLTGDMKVVQAK